MCKIGEFFKAGALCALLTISCSFQAGAGELSSNPFKKMFGNWKGMGKITPPGGAPERVSCRVKYKVMSNGNKARQNIRCAGTGYWITATSNLRYTPGTRQIKGTWTANYGGKHDTKNKISGRIDGSIINDKVSVSLIGEGFSTGMNVIMEGAKKQKVIIDSLATLDLRR